MAKQKTEQKKSFILPSTEDTVMIFEISATENLTIDAFDLDEMFSDSVRASKESLRNWKDEFRDLVVMRFKKTLTTGQILYMYGYLDTFMEELKKKLSSE